MRVVYHPSAGSLSDSALRAWLLSTLSSMATPPAPGIALDLGQPDYPYLVESRILSDDRNTLAGAAYSRISGSRREGTLGFSNVHSGVLPAWRAWFDATQGFRRPFAVELPDGRSLAAIAPGAFPLALVSQESCDGALALVEWL